MARFGFCGPTYASQSLRADAQRCINWIPERVESEQGRSFMTLYPRMGSKAFVTLAGETSVPALFAQNGRLFAAGVNFWEVFPNGTATNRGALAAINGPVTIVGSNTQLLICAGGSLWVYTLATNTLVPVNMAQFNGLISLVAYSDGFFLALQTGSQNFYTSAVLNPLSWSGLDAEQVNYFPDNIVSMIVDHRELWIVGAKQALGYYNSGTTNAPFAPIPGAFVETGAIAVQGLAKLDNSPFWLGTDERGGLVAWRSSGYSPQRVSNHAVEATWASYAVFNDAITYAMQDRGHTFWVIYFPAASKTWVFDASTNMWHEWTYLDPNLGEIAHRSMCHAFAFNQHVVGDWKAGKIYTLSSTYYDDDGTPIKRTRRAPHVSTEDEWMFHQQMQVDLDVGLASFASTLTPTAIILQAPNGSLWSLGISDAGILSQTSVPSGTPQTLFLTDLGGVVSWQIKVSNAGVLSQTAVTFNSVYAKSQQMVSASGTLLWSLYVLADGSLQQTKLGPVLRDTQISLRWSDDGANTWSNFHQVSAGGLGKYLTRAIWRRLGRSRHRVYEVSCSDPIPWRIVDAYLKATPGFEPTERMVHQLRKSA